MIHKLAKSMPRSISIYLDKSKQLFVFLWCPVNFKAWGLSFAVLLLLWFWYLKLEFWLNHNNFFFSGNFADAVSIKELVSFGHSLSTLSALNTHLLDHLDLIIKLFIFIVIDASSFLCFFSEWCIWVTTSGTGRINGIYIFTMELFNWAQRFQSCEDQVVFW